MKNTIFLSILALILMQTEPSLVDAEVQNIMLGSESKHDSLYCEFPKHLLSQSIAKLNFYPNYNVAGEKCFGYLDVQYNNDLKAVSFVELYKIELITKEEANPKKKTPLQIQKVSFDESLTNRISFEFPLAEELFESAKIVFYFSVRNPNENKSVEYTVEFKDLQKQFLRI